MGLRSGLIRSERNSLRELKKRYNKKKFVFFGPNFPDLIRKELDWGGMNI